MAALTKPYLNTKAEPDSVLPNLFPGNLPVAAATVLYANALVAKNASGYAVPASASPSQVVVGRVIKTYDNSGGAAGDIDAIIEQGAFDYGLASGANAVTVADIGAIVFAQDDNTISRTDQGGTLPVAGVLLNIYTPANSSTSRAIVQVGASLGFGLVASNGANKARAVVTSIGAYTAASGVLTANANGALAAQDGVTLAVGDVVMLPKVVAGGATVADADMGPYVVTSLGAAGAKYVLTRPSWFAHGAGIPLGYTVDVGGEGTVWAGISWRSFTVKGAIVGTTNAAFFPRCHKGTQTLAAGAGTASGLFAAAAAQATATDTTAAAAVKVVLTAGNGTGQIVFTGTGADVIAFVVTNF